MQLVPLCTAAWLIPAAHPADTCPSTPCLQVSTGDLETYNKLAVGIAKKYFSLPDIDDYYKKKDARPLIFCHFARGLGERVYDEVADYAALYKTLMEALGEYNETNAVMDLVLFEDAMKHVCR